MDSTLIQTKLHLPVIRGDLVERPSLLQRLNQNTGRNFTLVAAPAGFGKTTLIASWVSGLRSPAAWLSLDEFDNDTAVFLHYVIAAIQQIMPQACRGLSRALQAPDLPTTGELAALMLDDLSQLPEPILLALDDYHLIHNPDILQLVGRILEQAHNRLHLVLVSRRDPLLPLPRLRLQQGMVEIRERDLRFSDEEAAQFWETAVPHQSDPDAIIRLNRQVEGWIAGLRLASLTVQRPEQTTPFSLDSLGDAHRFIATYLFTEVLAQQSLEVQEFLLQTAFVDRFCADLGCALVHFSSPNSSAKTVIADIQQANIFIISLDEMGGWFRYHHLFQQMLQQKATAQLGQTAVLALRNRAGDWFAGQGFVDEALHYYLDAENMATATTASLSAGTSASLSAGIALIEQNSRNLLNGLERRRLEQWLDLLPEEIVWQRPRLLVAKAWLFYRHWRLRAMASVLTRLQHCLAQETVALTAEEQQFVRGQMNVLQSATLYLLDAAPQKSIVAAERALSQLPAAERGAMGTALGYWALSIQAEGEMGTAVSRLQQALANPAPLGPAVMQLYLSLSFVQLTAGNLLALKQIVDQFSALTQKTGMGAPAACWVSGIYHYEINQLDKAQQAFETTVSLHYGINFVAAFDSWLALIRICQEQGDFVGAQAYLDVVQAETLRLDNHELLPVIEAVQAYQSYLEGDTAVALRWASAFQADDAPGFALLTFSPPFFWVRLTAALGDGNACESARRILETKLANARTNHHVRRQIQLLAHLALLETRLGNVAAARHALKTAVKLAQPGGFVRSFLDCGLALRPLFQQLQQQAIAPYYIAQLLAAHPSTGPQEPAQPPIETILTEREVEVLRLMQAGYSNIEMAQILVISLYTVKRHASNIYRKLGVNGRRQAVYKAQQAGILSSK